MSAKNALRPADIPSLIDNVHAALIGLDSNNEVAAAPVVKPEPAVNPKKSVTPDHIICLEDGKNSNR
jgi:predicted transcriptional regulator